MGQAGALAEMLRDHCTLDSSALPERRDAYRHASKTTIRYGQQSRSSRASGLSTRRPGPLALLLQATLRRLDKAFAAFFLRLKAGQKPGHPRFWSGNFGVTSSSARSSSSSSKSSGSCMQANTAGPSTASCVWIGAIITERILCQRIEH
jgi:hypothetical protein